MIYVYLLYGAAFVALAFALGLQARLAVTDRPFPRRVLWLLAAFAIVHAVAEWVRMAGLIEQRLGRAPEEPFELAAVLLLAVSFSLLLWAGLVLLERVRAPLAAAWLVPVALLAAWGSAGALAIRELGAAGAVANMEVVARWALCLPAAGVTSAGLLLTARRLEREDRRAAQFITAAGLVLAGYGVVSGLVVPMSPFPAPRILELDEVRRVTRVPPELVRGALAASFGLLVSEAFVFETTTWIRSQVEHLRDDFISLVAHDLRSPLNAVQFGVAILERLSPRSPEREAHVLRAIASSTRTMRRIVDDLLDATRVESRRLRIAPEPLDAAALVRRVVEFSAPPAGARRLRLAVTDPLPSVLADPARVEQVLENLLTNAFKYSPPDTEILVEAAPCPEGVKVSVTNDVEVLPASGDLPRLFERNFRARTAEQRSQGLGIGLYIARGLVEAHGGTIRAEALSPRRIAFRFVLPCSRQPRDDSRPGVLSPQPAR